MSFAPEVIVCEPGREFGWKGRVFLPGVFDGEHHFRPSSDGTSTPFAHGDEFTGILVPLVVRGSMLSGTEAGFAAMNAAPKAKVEGT